MSDFVSPSKPALLRYALRGEWRMSGHRRNTITSLKKRNEEAMLRKYTKDLFDAHDRALREIQLESIHGFECLFKEHSPKKDSEHYHFIKIESPESFENIWSGRGMYIIASDFEPDLETREGCRLQIDGLPVIYRGQADLVGERVRSHLDNKRYREMKKVKGQVPWSRCLKLDREPGNGGINFDEAPYRNHQWAVLVLPLRKTTTEFRNCAEWGFDKIFGKPIASNEKKKSPTKSTLG
ncbi:hypothetical protein [Burkholderia stagnalis]|uniref:hypothetical protein n=1 Tax=Burkholderia stagnalis TaxID=1503054 RepID=UPI0012D9D834|nr:hypothetical protein [Burkholderia stagnalis]